MVPWSKGPRYLKVTFKYELDSKEGPSCKDIRYKKTKEYKLFYQFLAGGLGQDGDGSGISDILRNLTMIGGGELLT